MPSTPQMPVLSRRLRQFGGGALSGRTPSPLTAFATAGMSDQRRAVATGTGSNGSPAPLGYRPCGLPRHHLRGDRRRERSGAGHCLLQMAPQGPGGDRPPGTSSLSAVAPPWPRTAREAGGVNNAIKRAKREFRRRINPGLLPYAGTVPGLADLRPGPDAEGPWRGTLYQPRAPMRLDSAARAEPASHPRSPLPGNVQTIRDRTGNLNARHCLLPDGWSGSHTGPSRPAERKL